MHAADVLELARDDLRTNGFTADVYGTSQDGPKCMLGAIAQAEHGTPTLHECSRPSDAWHYVMKAAKKSYPLSWRLRLGPDNRFPEDLLFHTFGGRRTARRLMRKALKMAKKDARIEAKKARIEAKTQVAEEAESIVRSAAEEQEHKTSLIS